MIHTVNNIVLGGYTSVGWSKFAKHQGGFVDDDAFIFGSRSCKGYKPELSYIYRTDPNYDESEDIYIWNMDNMEFTKSKIKFPVPIQSLQCRAAISFNEIEEIVVNGCLRQSVGVGIGGLPQDIVTFVHLINRLSGEHWKRDLSEILCVSDGGLLALLIEFSL